jgi:cysteinyl-tRNA synthetase
MDTSMDEARASLARLYTALRDTEAGSARHEDYERQFNEVMNDDFNTPQALAVLHEIARQLNRLADKRSQEGKRLAATLKYLGGVLGLLQNDPVAFLQSGGPDDKLPEAEIEALIKQRNDARRLKNFAESDRIRALLAERGVVLEDGPQGTTWRRG